MSNHRNRRVLCAVAAVALAGAAPVFAQAPPPGTPPSATSKPAEQKEESDALRIRGLVESVDATGVSVQLSTGISLRVDIGSETPVFSAARVTQGDLQGGAELAVRTRAPQIAGENTVAGDVLVMPAAAASKPAEMLGMNVRGSFKSIDKSGEKPVLVVTEKGADRRLSVTSETSFWRLQPATLGEVKKGMSISVLVTRDEAGSAGARRALFGSPPPGSMLPL